MKIKQSILFLALSTGLLAAEEPGKSEQKTKEIKSGNATIEVKVGPDGKVTTSSGSVSSSAVAEGKGDGKKGNGVTVTGSGTITVIGPDGKSHTMEIPLDKALGAANALAVNVGEAKTGEKVTYLGVITEDVSGDIAAQLGIPVGTGLIVRMVKSDSPAGKAGLKEHDVLTKLDDQLLVNVDQLQHLVQLKKPGENVTLAFIRGGKEQKVTATLASHQAEPRLPFPGKLMPGQSMNKAFGGFAGKGDRDGKEVGVILRREYEMDKDGKLVPKGGVEKGGLPPEARKALEEAESKMKRMKEEVEAHAKHLEALDPHVEHSKEAQKGKTDEECKMMKKPDGQSKDPHAGHSGEAKSEKGEAATDAQKAKEEMECKMMKKMKEMEEHVKHADAQAKEAHVMQSQEVRDKMEAMKKKVEERQQKTHDAIRKVMENADVPDSVKQELKRALEGN